MKIRYGEIEKIMNFLEEYPPVERQDLVDQLTLHPLEMEAIRGLVDDRLFSPSPKTIESVLVSRGHNITQIASNRASVRAVFNGRYETTMPIATCSESTVYRAIQQRPFMKNVVIRDYPNDDENFPYFLIHREMQKYSTLNHPCFAGLIDGGFDVGEGSSTVHNLVDGTSLLNYARLGKLQYIDILRVMSEVSSALQYTRFQGICDLPLTPSKFMVTSIAGQLRTQYTGFSPRVFNPGKLFEDRESTCSQMDLFCLAPETMTQDSFRSDGGADVYFLGGLFYLLITGINPLKDYGNALDNFEVYCSYIKNHKPMTVVKFCGLTGLRGELMQSMDEKALLFVSDSIWKWTRVHPEKRPDSLEAVTSALQNEISRVQHLEEKISESSLAHRGQSKSRRPDTSSKKVSHNIYEAESRTKKEKFDIINRWGKYVALAIIVLALFLGFELVRNKINNAMNQSQIVTSLVHVMGFAFVYRCLSWGLDQ